MKKKYPGIRNQGLYLISIVPQKVNRHAGSSQDIFILFYGLKFSIIPKCQKEFLRKKQKIFQFGPVGLCS